MDTLIPNRLSILGHPHRLALFRLLMRRYPDRVPATELAQALGVKPNTLSTYIGALLQAGLVTQQRQGTSLRYAIDMEATRGTIDYLLEDCCRGRPEICAPLAAPTCDPAGLCADRKYHALFICTGNSTVSILAESILRDIAGDRFVAYSSGTKPRAHPNPLALSVLEQNGHGLSGLRSKHIAEFHGPGAPVFDFVFTMCNKAANEDCPPWQGQPISAHWGLSHMARSNGSDAEKRSAVQRTYTALRTRLTAFTALPFATLDRLRVQHALDEIGQAHPEGSLK